MHNCEMGIQNISHLDDRHFNRNHAQGLTGEENSETSTLVEPRQIFLASLSGVSILDDLSFGAAGEPIAYG